MRRPVEVPADATDRGGVVVLVLLLGGLLTALGVGLVALSATERAVAGNYRSGVHALYAAEALAARVVLDLSSDAQWTQVLAGGRQSMFFDARAQPVTSWREPLDLAAMTSALQAETDAETRLGLNTPRWQMFASGTLSDLAGTGWEGATFLVGWVADDPAELDADPAVDSNGVVVVRALAIGLGGLRRSVQATVRLITSEGTGATEVRIVGWREVR